MELASNPRLKTEEINRQIAKYEYNHPGYGSDAPVPNGVQSGDHSRGNRKSILLYLNGQGRKHNSYWSGDTVDNPAITHQTSQATWRLYRSERQGEPDFRMLSSDARRDAALEKLDKILGS